MKLFLLTVLPVIKDENPASRCAGDEGEEEKRGDLGRTIICFEGHVNKVLGLWRTIIIFLWRTSECLWPVKEQSFRPVKDNYFFCGGQVNACGL